MLRWGYVGVGGFLVEVKIGWGGGVDGSLRGFIRVLVVEGFIFGSSLVF